MAYTTRESIEGNIPAAFLERALWAEGEEETGLLDTIIANADTEINGYLESRYDVPFSSPIPGIIANASLILCCEALYRRQGTMNEANPWSQPATNVRDQLAFIGEGKATLGTDVQPPVSAFDEPTLIFDQ